MCMMGGGRNTKSCWRDEGTTGLAHNLVPAGPSWGCLQRVDSSDLAYEGLKNTPWIYLLSAKAGELSTSQCPSFPIPYEVRCWWVNKNQATLFNGHLNFAKQLAVLQHANGFVTELHMHGSWVHCCPQRNLMKVTLNALNTSSELRHHLETMSWEKPRCWCTELTQDPGADMLLPVLPQPQLVPHMDFGSRGAAVSGAKGCCAGVFIVAGAGWEVVKIQEKMLFSFFGISLSGIFQFLGLFQHTLILISFLSFVFLCYMFPSYVYSLFCFIQM